MSMKKFSMFVLHPPPLTPPHGRRGNKAAALLFGYCLCTLVFTAEALGQGIHHPFAVGANEGAVGNISGWAGWILAQESGFYRLLTGTIRAAKENGSAIWALAGLSFAYGVFHAAGPGHGKAIITSYMVSNEKALRRGLVLSLLAALLQAIVAVAIVGIAAWLFNLTARYMTEAAHGLEIASYIGIVLLGVALVWSKGSALYVALRSFPASGIMQAFGPPKLAFETQGPRAFAADDCTDHIHGPQCGHLLAADPTKLGTDFHWKSALATVLTAGARPCSGAILVLVFTLAQGIFWLGIGATFAMSLGTALTTGSLAAFAVFLKKLAVKFSGTGSYRALVVGRFIEVAAALAVLTFGLALLLATWAGHFSARS
jgi:nickel/cobalt exporter